MLDRFYSNIKNHIHLMHIPVKYRHTEFHLHDFFEIYIFLNGNAKYFIEKTIYPLSFGDILITNNTEIHKSVVIPGKIYDIISIQINPELIKELNSKNYNLLNCFINRPNWKNNKILLPKKDIDNFLLLLNNIESVYNSTSAGNEILLVSLIMQLLIILNKNFKGSNTNYENILIPYNLIPILEYIDFYLYDDLSLDTLEKKFNINKYYLSRLFKTTFNSTIHEYIIFKRLSIAKRLLKNGKNVTEACHLSGFNDYSHFIRIFKNHFGISPGQFKKYNKN